MANNYRQSSLAVEDVTDAERKWIEDYLAETFADDPIGFEYSFGTDGLWIRDAGEWLDTNQVAALLCAFLKAHRPHGVLGFTYADTCSRPRVDEFSGGAVLCTARGARWMDAGEWLHTALTRARKRKAA